MEEQNTDGVWKDTEKWIEFISFSLYFHFTCAAERDGGSLQGSHLIFANHCPYPFLKLDYI